MKKTLFTHGIFLFSLSLFSQVGINTEDVTPGVILDINGRMRVRDYSAPPSSRGVEFSYDKIMVMDDNGIVSAQYTNKILKQNDTVIVDIVKKNQELVNGIDTLIDKKINTGKKLSFVRGRGNAQTKILSLSILSNWRKIAFDYTDLDLNKDYNISTTNNENKYSYCFTAPQDGVYHAYAQYELVSLLSASSIGIGIFKINKNDVTELLAEDTFASLTVLGIDVSSPTRKTETLIHLEKGEKLFFAVQAPLSISLLKPSSSSTFFTIYQVN